MGQDFLDKKYTIHHKAGDSGGQSRGLGGEENMRFARIISPKKSPNRRGKRRSIRVLRIRYISI